MRLQLKLRTYVNFITLKCLIEAGLSLKRDPVDRDRVEDPRETSWRDPVMDRAKDKLAHISIARNIYLSRRCQLIFLQK